MGNTSVVKYGDFSQRYGGERMNSGKESRNLFGSKEHLFIPKSTPKIGVAGKTGAWRIFRPIINYDKCTKCYQCYMVCPDVAISVEKFNEFPKIDYDYCKGCGICASVCPVKAIQMVKEE